MLGSIGAGAHFPGFAMYIAVDVDVTLGFSKVPQTARHVATETFHSPLIKRGELHGANDEFHRLVVHVAKDLSGIHNLVLS